MFLSGMWWLTAAIPARGKLRQKDRCERKDHVRYTVSSRPGYRVETVSKSIYIHTRDDSLSLVIGYGRILSSFVYIQQFFIVNLRNPRGKETLNCLFI